MDVCMLSMKGNFDKNLGQGIQIYIYQLLTHLQSMIKQPDSIEKVELGFGNSLNTRKVTFTIAQMLHDFSRYDIVHMPAPTMYNPRCRGSTITSLHELMLIEPDHPFYPMIFPQTPKPKISNPVDSFIGGSIQKQIMESDYLLFNSTQTMVEAAKLGYPKDRMYLTSPAIDSKFSEPKIRSMKHKNFTVGYFGSLASRKNLPFAIKAFMSLDEKSARFELWGKKKFEYEKLLRMASGDDRIEFKGFAPEEKKIDIYHRFDVLLFPSFYEGWGNPAIEAQALGIPVIICKDSLIPKEVRKHCFEAKDEEHMGRMIEEIMKNGYNKSKRDAAAKYARGFTWERCARVTLDAYMDIMKR